MGKKIVIILGCLVVGIVLGTGICMALWKGGQDTEEAVQAEILVAEQEEEKDGKEREQQIIEKETEQETRTYEEFLASARNKPALFSRDYTEEEYREWKEALWKLAECEIIFDRTLENEWGKWRRIVAVDREKERYYLFGLDEDGMIASYDAGWDYEGEKLSADRNVYSGSLNEQAHQAYEAFLGGEESCYSKEWDYRFTINGTVAAWLLNDKRADCVWSSVENFLSYSIESSYLFVDFDDDGEDELFYYFLGGGMGMGNYMLIKYEEDEGLVSLYQEESGARCQIHVYDNGVFVQDGSSGASVHGWYYYRVTPEGEKDVLAYYHLDYLRKAEFTCYMEPGLSYTLENPHKGETYEECVMKEEDFEEIDEVIDTFREKYCGMTLLEWRKTVLDTH